MSDCYLCDKVLCDWNSSKEHIIPNALGGHLKSQHILCKECNSILGEELDNILSSRINLPTLLDIKRDRGKTKEIVGKTQSGKKYLIDRNLKPKNEKIETKILENGKRSIIVRDEKEARKILKQIKKKNPKINVESELSKIKWKNEYIDEPLFFKNDILDGKEAFRAITKIAIGFYCNALNDTINIRHLIPFLKNEEDRYIVYHYFPDEKIYQPQDGEVSHIIYLKGNKSERILTCYIELYNCHNFLVVLNNNYMGFDFAISYGYDLLKEMEITPSFEFEISRDELESLPLPGPDDAQTRFFDRLKNVYEIKGIELILREKQPTPKPV